MSDRFYLTASDVRYQQGINKTVTELVQPGPHVNRRRAPIDSPSDPWHCEISKSEDDTISVKVIAARASEDYHSVIFRGQTFHVDPESFIFSSTDLDQNVYFYLVKTPYNPVRFLLAPSHHDNLDSFSAGCVCVAHLTKSDGVIKAYMHYDRMFEWIDDYQSNGKFTADLIFTGIIHNDDEPEPIQFYDFIEIAEQKLMIFNNYAMMINGLYVVGTSVYESNPAGSIDSTVLSLRPEGHETDALQVFWIAKIDYNEGGRFKLSAIHYELITDTSNIYHIQGGIIRIPVIALSKVDQYKPVRMIEHKHGAPNIPELSILPIWQNCDAEHNAWVYIDRSTSTVRLTIEYTMDGGGIGQIGLARMNVPFTSFINANEAVLSINSYYNISNHSWSVTWFELNETAITTKPNPSGGSDNKQHRIPLAYISYNTDDSCPYVVGQNCTRVAQFNSGAWRFEEIAGQISALGQRVTSLEERVTNLEQRN